MLWYAILASIIVSSISLVAIIVIILNKKITTSVLKIFISIASGVLLASVFLELLPDVFNKYALNSHNFFFTVLLGILGFYLIERLIHWHHCQGVNCPPDEKTHIAVTNLLGDGIHNFVDGILIGASFIASPVVGIAVTLAIIAHEIPQEISDAGILLYAGLSKTKVVIFNFLTALTSIIGTIIAFKWAASVNDSVPYFVAVAAGNFIYLALADLIPELHH